MRIDLVGFRRQSLSLLWR